MKVAPMSEELPQIIEVPRVNHEESWGKTYAYIMGQLACYDRLVDRGEQLSDIASEEMEDLNTLAKWYKARLEECEEDNE